MAAAIGAVVLNGGGIVGESGSARPLLFVTVLGALAGAAAVVIFVSARRVVPGG